MKVLYANIYRYNGGYMFGDNMIRHKTLGEALAARKENPEWAAAVRLEIPEDGSTEIRGKVITKRQ